MTAKIKLNAASGGGSFSLQAPSSSSNDRVMTLPDTADGTILTTTNPRSGNIIQVVQTVKDNSFHTTSSSMTDITGMSVDITPTSASNKILINVSLYYGGDNAAIAAINLLRGSTITAQGAALSNATRCSFAVGTESGTNAEYYLRSASYQYLDSPSTTSTTTYKLQAATLNANFTFIINTPYEGGIDQNTNTYVCRTTSTITAMEVAA